MEVSNPSLGSLLFHAARYVLEESRWDESQRCDFVNHLLVEGWFGTLTVCSATQTVVEGSDRLRCLLDPGNMVVNLNSLRVDFQEGELSPTTLPLALFLGDNAGPQVRAAVRGQSAAVLVAAEKVLQVLSWPSVPVFQTGHTSLAMSRQSVRLHNLFR